MPLVLRANDEVRSLPDRLQSLGQARRRAIVAAGAFQFAAILLASLALVGIVDVVWQLPAFLRALALFALLGGGGLFFLRRVWFPAAETVRPLNVALLLEQRYPKLNDALASAVEFLDPGLDPNRGSQRLRRIAVLRAENILDRYVPEAIIPSGRAWRGFWLFAFAFVLVAPLALLDSARAGRALQRLAMPYGAVTWPTKTQIQLLEPRTTPVRLGKGDGLAVRFVVRGVIPERAVVAVRFGDGGSFDEPVGLEADPNSAQPVEVSWQLEASRLTRDFQFQIQANDAQTEWHSVVVAPKPKLVLREGRASPQLHLTFPAYTDLPAKAIPDGAAALEGIAGTRIALKAAADRRIVSAWLRPQLDPTEIRTASACAALAGMNPILTMGCQLLAEDIAAEIPVRVSGPEGTWLDVDFIPNWSGLYTLGFTDETGLTGTLTLNLRIEADPAPVVVLDRPARGQDPLTLLPTASLPVFARAEDRTFAVRNLFLEYRVGGLETPWQNLSLADVRTLAPALAAVASAPAAGVKPIASVHQRTLPLARFTRLDGRPLQDGDTLTLRAAAHDWDTVSVLKEPGRSAEIEIRIVSKTSLDALLTQELAKLRPELLRQREELRGSREKAQEVAKAAAANPLTDADAAKLRAAEQGQRGVRNKIADPRDGLKATAQQLQDLVKANQLPRTPATDRVEAVAEGLARVTDQHLDPADSLLSAAKEETDKPGKPDAAKLAKDLAQATKHQTSAEAALEDLLRQLEQWGGAAEVRSEARAIKDKLTQANEKATQTTDKIEPGTPVEKLTPAEKAELARAADRFNQLAERTTAALTKAENLATQKETTAKQAKADANAKRAEAKATPNPAKAAELEAEAAALEAVAAQAQSEADALRKAVREAGGQALPETLRSAGKELERNNASQSADARQAAAEKLDKFSQALTEQPRDTGDELKKKNAAVESLDDLANQQDELRKKVKEANQIADPMKRQDELNKLAREQDRLREKVEEQVQRLTRERQNPEAVEQLRKAAEQMAAAREQLEKGQSSDMKQADALDRLDEAANQLDQQRKEDQTQLAREKREQLAEQVKALRDKLKATDEEAARIQAEVLKAKGWDRAKLASLRDLEDRAAALAQELRTFSEKHLEPLPVYRQLVDQAAVLTDRAGKLFAERKDEATDAAGTAFDPVAEAAADDRTRRPLRTALRRLEHVAKSFEEDKKPKEAGGAPDMPPMMPGGEPGMMPPADQQAGGLPPQAQIKALRSLQAELNERTQAFAKAHPTGSKLSEADREELEELERSQREVADLFRKIASSLQPKAPASPEIP